MTDAETRKVLVLGTCSWGPFRHAEANLLNREVKWLSWGYHTSYIEPSVLEDIRSGKIHEGTAVLFSVWDIETDTANRPVRFGRVDYVKDHGNYVALTIFLERLVSSIPDLALMAESRFLCQYGGLQIGHTQTGASLLPRS